ALAAPAAMVIGGVTFLQHVARLQNLVPAPSRTIARAGPPKRKPARPRQLGHRPRPALRTTPGERSNSSADAFMRRAPLYFGLAAWVALLALALAGAVTVDRRLRNRLIRRYERYEVKLSMHDDAKPGDLEDMIEAIGAAVRKRYNDRVSDGQPFIALELWHRPSAVGMQWTLCLTCEVQLVGTLEGVIAGAYPDVRIGHE